MKKEKGFTLIEITAAVIILGIISIIAIISYTSSMKRFRVSYYTTLENSMVEAGRDFFNDNRSYRPSSVFETQKVSISLLETKKYLKNVKDYNGDRCDNNSYVIAIKNGKNDFIYHACLICSEDMYSNESDMQCNSAWDDNTTISPALKKLSDKYVYKNTPKEKLREMLATQISVVKYDKGGNELASIDGTGLDGVPTILPENIDTVDTSKIGVYEVEYKYEGTTTKRNVYVYENGAPSVTIKMKNVYASKISGNIVTEATETKNYNENDWGQELLIDFNAGDHFHSEIGEGGVKASTYQWNKDGHWSTICSIEGTSGTCSVNLTQEMNQNIKFRLVDTEGNISGETPERTLKIDRTAPTCTLRKAGTTIANDWYTSDVRISFADKKDNTSEVPEAKSDLGFYQIRKENVTYYFDRRTSSEKADLTEDTDYVYYYGFVEDKAKNYAKCSVQVRKDSVKPTCTIMDHSTFICNDDTSKIVSVTFGKNNSIATHYTLDYLSEWQGTFDTPSKSEYIYSIKDHAGNELKDLINYYSIEFNNNGGTTQAPATVIKRSSETVDLTPVTRKPGAKMIGWNDYQSAKTALSNYVVKQISATLYAIYQDCPNGYYTNELGDECLQCPLGYRAGRPAGDISQCVKDTVECASGKYLEKNKTSCTTCETGYYCPGGTFKVVEGGGRVQCDSGYSSPEGSISANQCCKETTITEEYCPGEMIGSNCVSSTEGSGPACTSAGWTCTLGASDHCYEGIATVSGTCSPSKDIKNCRCRKIISKSTRTVKKITCQ